MRAGDSAMIKLFKRRQGALVLALGLAACGGGADRAPAPAPPPAVPEQFTITLPEGWTVYDQNAAHGQPGLLGVIVFAPVDLAQVSRMKNDKATEAQARQALVAVDSGRIPSFFVERYAAGPGSGCAEGLPPAERERVLQDLRRTARGPQGDWVLDVEEVAEAPMAGCAGLRVRLGARLPAGGGFDFLSYIVSDGQVNYDFTLRARRGFFEKNLPVFEQAVGSLKLKGR